MSAHSQIIPSPAASPARCYWLKRLSLGVGCLFLVFAAVYSVWRYEAHRRWNAARARAVAELKPLPDIPAAQNAATYLTAADAASPTRWIQVEKLVANLSPLRKNIPPGGAETLALARTARFQPYLRWPPYAPSSGPTQSITSVASHLVVAAVHSHANGRDTDAMEYLLDLIAATGRPSAPPPGGIGLDFDTRRAMQFAGEAIYLIAPNLIVLPQTSAATQPGGPASRAQVRALIEALLDDSLYAQPFVERLRVTSVEIVVSYPQLNNNSDWFLGPLQKLTLARIGRDLGRAADLIEAGRRREAMGGSKDPRTEHTAAGSIIDPYRPAMWNIIAGHYQALTERRVAAIVLAVRLYAMDHAGNPPPSLEALVPTYLKAVPQDPLADGNRPLLYVASPRPAVMSVGHNGIDDGTFPARVAAVRTMPQTLIEQEHWIYEDAVYVLPVTPPSATTAASQPPGISPPALPE